MSEFEGIALETISNKTCRAKRIQENLKGISEHGVTPSSIIGIKLECSKMRREGERKRKIFKEKNG